MLQSRRKHFWRVFYIFIMTSPLVCSPCSRTMRRNSAYGNTDFFCFAQTNSRAQAISKKVPPPQKKAPPGGPKKARRQMKIHSRAAARFNTRTEKNSALIYYHFIFIFPFSFNEAAIDGSLCKSLPQQSVRIRGYSASPTNPNERAPPLNYPTSPCSR